MERTRSPITTETDIDLTAALLPSGGTRSHHHAIKTAVSETGPLSAPSCQPLPSPTGCHYGSLAKVPPGTQPGAGCQLWNTPYPTLHPGNCAGKGFGQSTLPFSFGTNAAPPPRAPCLMLRCGEPPTVPSWLGSHPGTRGKPGRSGGQSLECRQGPDTGPGLDNGSAPLSAFEKPPIWESCSPCTEAWQGQDASPLEVCRGLQEGQGCVDIPPDSAISLPGGSAGWTDNADPVGQPVATETAAELQRDDSFTPSKGLEQPASSREGAQGVPAPLSPMYLQDSAMTRGGSRQACCAPSEPELPTANPREEEQPLEAPSRAEEEGEVRRCRGTELGRWPGTRRKSSKPIPLESASLAQRASGLGPAGASAPMKTSVEDAYGRLTKACGLSLLEELRRTFLDADGSCFSLLDSGLVLGRVEEHAALGLALLPMRDGRKLATALPNSSLFLYYALGRQFYITEKLTDCWFRARDRVTGESMLVKKVPVVSDWRKMLHNFLFLPPHPSLLVPYAVLYDRNGSILYLMQDRDVRAVGRPPEWPIVETARMLREVLDFLRYCKRHGFHPGDVGTASIYTAQGICFDPSSLSSSEGPCAFRKSMKTCLGPLLAQHQELLGLDALVDSMCQDLEEEEILAHSDLWNSESPGTGLT